MKPKQTDSLCEWCSLALIWTGLSRFHQWKVSMLVKLSLPADQRQLAHYLCVGERWGIQLKLGGKVKLRLILKVMTYSWLKTLWNGESIASRFFSAAKKFPQKMFFFSFFSCVSWHLPWWSSDVTIAVEAMCYIVRDVTLFVQFN